jgi:putative Ca2+/H+ antiporter (TMEM165/GDT1 family)
MLRIFHKSNRIAIDVAVDVSLDVNVAQPTNQTTRLASDLEHGHGALGVPLGQDASAIVPTASSGPATVTSSAPTSAIGACVPEEVVRVFFSTFVTIFLAELGDKTQVATLLMSAESHQPWVVFAGAASALIATSLVGVLVGQWLYRVLPPKRLEKATGMILALVAVLLFMDVAGM